MHEIEVLISEIRSAEIKCVIWTHWYRFNDNGSVN